MASPAWELADIFRLHGQAYRERHRLPHPQLRLMRAIEICRTPALGGHVEECDRCGHLRYSYHSCRNRHCPKCGSLARARWLHRRQEELLPVEYFHVVFTLPEPIADLALRNKKTLYDLLFRVSMDTLLTIARDRKHLGAEIGFFGILHTWGQNLRHHPHVHYVIPGGGIGPDHDRWIGCREGFLLPVRVLSALFRNRFLQALQRLYDKGQLCLPAAWEYLRAPQAWARFLKPLSEQDWVVYAKPPFGGPRQVLDYLGRYTHRVAISNHRITNVEDGKVSFRWKDYRNGELGTLTIQAEEFIRRFLLHTLPDRFQRIRFGGFFANRHRRAKLALIRQWLCPDVVHLLPLPQDCKALLEALTGVDLNQCPVCKPGRMVVIGTLAPVYPAVAVLDSS